MNFYELYTAVTLGFLTAQAVTFFVAKWYVNTQMAKFFEETANA